MVNINSLKSKKLPIGVFAGLPKGPKPARIFITIQYEESFEFLRSYRGFKFSPQQDTRTIMFEIPVTPPTVEQDTGNSKDTENVARVGEVVLPKFKKAIQFRWESFFPYNTSAPYLNTTVRNLSWDSLNQYKEQAVNAYNSAVEAFTGTNRLVPTPDVYVKIFNRLAKSESPLLLSMTYYDGGHLPATAVTLDSFKTNPDSTGDFIYSISFVEYTDVKPKLLNNRGEEVIDDNIKVEDKILFKSIRSVGDFFKFCKQNYGKVSKSLIWAFATYNGVRNLVFDGILKAWKIKGTLKDLAGRFGILNNIIGVSKITRKDTAAVSQALKKLSFTKASKQMAELLAQNSRNIQS